MALLAVAGLAGCAHVSAPGGGPPDTIPPEIIAIEPPNLSVQPEFEGRVRFLFNESISEREIRRAVALYPWEQRPNVDKGGEDLKVRPREDWVAGRIYHVIVEPFVQDLFGNRIPQRIHYTFSTGMPIPENRVHGTIFDRITGQPLPSARLDMLQIPDSLRYGAVADSAGRYDLSHLPAGDYLAIGYEDRNQNRRSDRFERADTQRVEFGSTDTLEIVFRIFEHDTVAPVLARAQALDSLTVELEFDRYLDPDAPISMQNVDLSAATGAAVPLDTVLHQWEYSAYVRERRRAAGPDTVPPAVPGDTLGPPADTVPVERPAGPPEPADTVPPEVAALPARVLMAIAAQPIPPGSTTVRAFEIRGLSGLVGGGAVTYEQPEPEPPRPAEPEPGPPEGGEVPPDSARSPSPRRR